MFLQNRTIKMQTIGHNEHLKHDKWQIVTSFFDFSVPPFFFGPLTTLQLSPLHMDSSSKI